MASLPRDEVSQDTKKSPDPKKMPEALALGGEDKPELSPTSKEFKESFAQRRKSSQLLSPLRLRSNTHGATVVDGGGDLEEVQEEGVALFNIFVEEEIERNGIEETEVIEEAVSSATIQCKQNTPAVNVKTFQFESTSVSTSSSTSTSSTSHSNGAATPSAHRYGRYKYPKWARKGGDLRKLADAFARSPERQKVREKAAELLHNKNITAAMFWDLMSELFFQGHVTRERIVVLFCFCSDVAIFALQQHSVEYFHRFMVWTLQYIRNKVCAWVANNGGWDTVLSISMVPTIAKVAAAVAVGYVTYRAGKAVFNWISM